MGMGMKSAPQWPAEDLVIPGLYSSWITNDILACSRPTTKAIEKYNLVESFLDARIRCLINLQELGEHSSCGFGNETLSQLSYIPQTFMNNSIYYHHFPWPDQGTLQVNTLLDIVNVMRFNMKFGKIAVHCHAGLGRTGVLVAAYLMLVDRMSFADAVREVRAHRAKSVQTMDQVQCLIDFERYIKPLFVIYSSINLHDHSSDRSKAFTLRIFMMRQRCLLHGEERRPLMHIPKIITIIGVFVLRLFRRCLNECGTDYANTIFLQDFALSEYSKEQERLIERYKNVLNTSPTLALNQLSREQDISVLGGLLWEWFDGLMEPILSAQDIPNMIDRARITMRNDRLLIKDAIRGLQSLDKDSFYTIMYLYNVLSFLVHDAKQSQRLNIVLRTTSTLTHCNLVKVIPAIAKHYYDMSTSRPLTVNNRVISPMTAELLIDFFHRLIDQLVKLDLNESEFMQRVSSTESNTSIQSQSPT